MSHPDMAARVMRRPTLPRGARERSRGRRRMSITLQFIELTATWRNNEVFRIYSPGVGRGEADVFDQVTIFGGLKANLVKHDRRAATRDSPDEDVGREVLARCHAHGPNACCGDEGPEPVQAVLVAHAQHV